VADEKEQTFLAESSLPTPAPLAITASHVRVVSDEGAGSSTGKKDPQCTGNAAAPTATPGFVCLYPIIQGNLAAAPVGLEILGGSTGSGSGGAGAGKTGGGSKYGFGVKYQSEEEGETTVSYVWAYTAPTAEEIEEGKEQEAKGGTGGEPPPVQGWNQIKNQQDPEAGL